jgi:hypothetical protein
MTGGSKQVTWLFAWGVSFASVVLVKQLMEKTIRPKACKLRSISSKPFIKLDARWPMISKPRYVTAPSISFIKGEEGRETTEVFTKLDTWDKDRRFVGTGYGRWDGRYVGRKDEQLLPDRVKCPCTILVTRIGPFIYTN